MRSKTISKKKVRKILQRNRNIENAIREIAASKGETVSFESKMGGCSFFSFFLHFL